jgi:hypothetical protein
MILDSQLQFSAAQALTTTGGVATNVIDLSIARAIGNGEPMAVVFTVSVTADQTSGDEDYTFDVEYATDAGQTTGRQLVGRRIFESGTPTAPAQDADLLVAGFSFVIPVPPTTTDEDGQFLGVRYVLAGTTPLITVSASLQPQSMIDQSALYASGYSIT